MSSERPASFNRCSRRASRDGPLLVPPLAPWGGRALVSNNRRERAPRTYESVGPGTRTISCSTTRRSVPDHMVVLKPPFLSSSNPTLASSTLPSAPTSMPVPASPGRAPTARVGRSPRPPALGPAGKSATGSLAGASKSLGASGAAPTPGGKIRMGPVCTCGAVGTSSSGTSTAACQSAGASRIGSPGSATGRIPSEPVASSRLNGQLCSRGGLRSNGQSSVGPSATTGPIQETKNRRPDAHSCHVCFIVDVA